ncbi:hypothetical protein GCM10027598_74480 [Amycolatopsis oliviviridis]|uniref:Uncharacterized protein n=1 Tax=Amycolatopsis oliviviridis TaxID=1471590 RepID=A0ABQ3L441_9PSEU|nr:hypothetical protein GCM10017790_04420 [Amycolatopsis oliviviridis]
MPDRRDSSDSEIPRAALAARRLTASMSRIEGVSSSTTSPLSFVKPYDRRGESFALPIEFADIMTRRPAGRA